MRIFDSLYWRISGIFLLLFLIVGLAYVVITVQTAEQYFLQKQQRLNAHIGEQMIKEVQPFVDGRVNEQALDKIMHSMMAINPAVEVYLLDPGGKILKYVVATKDVKLERVDLEPIQYFLQTGGQKYVQGDDPRNPGRKKVFSAAAVQEDGQTVGYVYIILASEEYESVGGYLQEQYLLTLGGRNMVVTLLAALILGLVAIWLVTLNLRRIIYTVRQFQQGKLHARIPVRSKDELAQLALTFNEMADTIVRDIEKRQALDKLRRELVANVSHDLRAPLAVIQGYIETLLIKNEQLSAEERQQYLQTSLNSITKLEKMVKDLFELSKLEARQVHAEKEPFAISELIQDVCQKYKILAAEKQISIQADLPQNLYIVHADVALIERVLQNLIDNAIKFSPRGGSIQLRLCEAADCIQVQVSDTGPGIPPEEIPYVFDRYHKARQTEKDERQGAGLGLAIVKKILEIHNSSIQLVSQLGKGTTFSFQLPLYMKS